MERAITFSAMPVAIAELRPLLAEFEQQYHIPVKLRVIGWERERSEITGIAFQQQAVDVSMVAMPITSDLIGMDALRPFRSEEIEALGGADSFLASRWNSGKRPGSPQVWAIPWLVDMRAIYFWADMIHDAGLDAATAFNTPQQIEESIISLKKSGLELAWAAPTTPSRFLILHAVSSWIWAFGGDLFAPNGKQVIFHQPPAMAGMRHYFSLLQYLPPTYQDLHEETPFQNRQAAMTITGGWAALQPVSNKLCCVPVLDSSYLGGTDLVIWSHSPNHQAAFELIRFLTMTENNLRASHKTGFFSPRMSALTIVPGEEHTLRAAQIRAILTGRSYPCIPLVGLVEDRLSAVLAQIQQTVFANPTSDLDEVIHAYIDPLAARLNLTLS